MTDSPSAEYIPTTDPTDPNDLYHRSSSPPPLQPLSYSLSHVDTCYDRAIQYADQCNEGDTVLMNYFTRANGWTSLEYLQKIDGQMVTRRVDDWIHNIPANWTFAFN